MKKLIFLVVIGLFLANQSFAQIPTGYIFLKYLEGKDDFKKAYALGYIAGVVSAHLFFKEFKPNLKFICLPKEPAIKTGQFELIVLKWLKEHPGSLHKDADGIAAVPAG